MTRIRQETHAIGPQGGILSSTVVPQVQAIFPEGALTKIIKVGLQVGDNTTTTATSKHNTTDAILQSRRGLFGKLNQLFKSRSTLRKTRTEIETAIDNKEDIVTNVVMVESVNDNKINKFELHNRSQKENDDLFGLSPQKKSKNNLISVPSLPGENSLTSSVVSFGWDIVDKINENTGIVIERSRVPYVRREHNPIGASPYIDNVDIESYSNNLEVEDEFALLNANDSAVAITSSKDHKPKLKDYYILSACLGLFFPRVIRYAQLL